MILWIHDDVHPLEETMLVHGRPSVVRDSLNDGALPIYQVHEECEQAVFDDGKVRVVDPEKHRSVMVPYTSSVREQDVVRALSDAGYTHIQLVTVNGKYVGGLGYKVLRSHLNCSICMVQATMEG